MSKIKNKKTLLSCDLKPVGFKIKYQTHKIKTIGLAIQQKEV